MIPAPDDARDDDGDGSDIGNSACSLYVDSFGAVFPVLHEVCLEGTATQSTADVLPHNQ